MNLQDSFTPHDHSPVGLVAPQGDIINSVGEPRAVSLDLSPSLDTDVTPDLLEGARAPHAEMEWLQSISNVTKYTRYKI